MMAKNLPQRERGNGSPSPYTKYGKHPYSYPGWVVNHQQPPQSIRQELDAVKDQLWPGWRDRREQYVEEADYNLA